MTTLQDVSCICVHSENRLLYVGDVGSDDGDGSGGKIHLLRINAENTNLEKNPVRSLDFNAPQALQVDDEARLYAVDAEDACKVQWIDLESGDTKTIARSYECKSIDSFLYDTEHDDILLLQTDRDKICAIYKTDDELDDHMKPIVYERIHNCQRKRKTLSFPITHMHGNQNNYHGLDIASDRILLSCYNQDVVLDCQMGIISEEDAIRVHDEYNVRQPSCATRDYNRDIIYVAHERNKISKIVNGRIPELFAQMQRPIVDIDVDSETGLVFVAMRTKIACLQWEYNMSEDPSRQNSKKRKDVVQHVTDMKQMLEDTTLHDFVFIIGERRITCNACILYAQSSVFRAMLMSGMQEAQMRELHLEGSAEIAEYVKAMLHYMYTDRAIATYGFTYEDISTIVNVIVLADKYAVETVKEAYTKYFAERLTIYNINLLADIADLYHCDIAKQEVETFISRNITKLKTRARETFHAFVTSFPCIAAQVLLLL